MRRVKDHLYLYRRGDAFVFRRVVPESARSVFGKTAVHITLHAKTIADARREMQRHADRFEETLRLRSGDAPEMSKATQPPTRIEIDAAVRKWLTARLDRLMLSMSVPADPQLEETRLAELEFYADDVRSGLGICRADPPLLTKHIAEAIAYAEKWEIDESSRTYRYLLQIVARGQLEASRREKHEITGEPRVIEDATFAADEYRNDLERNRSVTRPASLSGLFQGYAAERKPAPATIKAWRRQLEAFNAFLGHDDAARVTTADVVAWKDRLLETPTARGGHLSPKTVKDTYLSVIRTIYRWGCENDKVRENPAERVKVRGPKRIVSREKGLTDEEANLILSASLLPPPEKLSSERAFARRWVPWICAYTGARVNEITQLRREDVFQVRGVWVIRITPEAGSTKSGQARIVALHPHLVRQGFTKAVARRTGPLFYDPKRHRGGSEGNPQAKKVGEHLAAWVRGIGVSDPSVQPNHGWRHRFKTVARLANMDAEIRDVIQGHSPRTVGETYGDTLPEVTFREIEKLPVYKVP